MSIIKLFTRLKVSKANEQGLVPMECLRVGHWDYPDIPGGLNVDQALLRELKANFDAGAKGFEVLLNREHDDDQQAGWVKALELAPDGNSLYAMTQFTDARTAQEVDEEKLKYCSSELDLAWRDPEDKTEKRVFEGLALTNRPYIKRLKPIGVVLSERAANLSLGDAEAEPISGPTGKDPNMGTQTKENEQAGGGAVSLSEMEAKLAEQSTLTQRLEAQLAERGKEAHALSVKVRLSETKARINKAFRRGKITPAFATNLLKFAETVLTYGESSTIKLSEKRKPLRFKLDEAGADQDNQDKDREPVDELDVIENLLDIVETLPDALATNVSEEKADLDDDDPLNKPEDEADALDKLAQIAMKENKDLSYGKALELAERKILDRNGGRR